ncbi:probable rRNA-processing protein EBP2 [Liolophura sinensis]|uniref:probable rRNA-processing protein EBP2 n=1 Tax=Liolophura sinensis TaxID=3198878 RepID=UPI003159811C
MSDDEVSFSDSEDSDVELQKAFKRGELKGGLNVEVAPPPKWINNKEGLRQKMEELRLPLDWIERMDMTNDPAPAVPGTFVDEEEDDVNNDFQRELKFYRQAQATVLDAIPKLHKLGVLTKRPEDYFAQMAKSDDHMKRVREKLLAKQIGMERSEKAKKLRDLRKYGKKVQQDVLQKRQKEKKEMMDAVKKYRTGKKNKLDFLEKEEGPPSKRQKKSQTQGTNKKRDYKNSKFGFGGQKKRSKSNTAQSTSDMSGVNRKASFSKPGKGRKLLNRNKKRPGKSRRKTMKNWKR